ncbi:DUF3857 domain-containing protein [Dysgonomonas gadei]|uniref:DUF3857 domain-containing protein n=1 Tax=Dysgonomonas gadei ATCC BAA-286 TaxID=742766 RepID=F5IU93_9BACT|nr:DUF3857 domain-containing protein [Dysgonomonas gadei]EGK03272.1 hypothetical protein HMPREF9455_00660 [Dysgonomonas gadei ATCC BAA-286]
MKNVLVIIAFFLPILVSAQAFRSETIKYTSVNKINGDKLQRIDSVVLQINERMGDHDAEILIPYSKGDKVSIGDAWIEDMNGNIVRKLKGNEVKDRSSISDISLYEDDFVKSFTLKHHIYPYRIVYSFKISHSRFLSSATLNYVNSRRPLREGNLIVETPFDQPIRFKEKNVHEPQIDTLRDIIRYNWTYSYVPTQNTELYSSPNTSKAPSIYTVPLNFKFGESGSFDSWVTYGNWIFRLNKDKDVLPLAEQQKIGQMLSGIDNDMEKVKVLYKYMQDYTRYINVSINLGGLQTYPASYVCANRYGDCKALTNYMQAILKYSGIKSYYTLIYADDRVIDVDTGFPAQVFNHAILTVPFGKDTVYLECTSKNTPFGYMGTFTQGRKALLVDEHNTHFVTIPSLEQNDVLCSRSLLVNTNTSEVSLSATERGDRYELFNSLASEVNKNTVDKYIRNNILSGSYELLDFKFDKEEEADRAQISLLANCKIHNLYKEYGNNIILSSFPIPISSFESPEKRTQDVQLDYPQYYKDTIHYELDKTISKMPDSVELKSEFGEYSLKFEADENKLIVYKTILINPGRYSLDRYKDFYDFIMFIRNNESKNYYLEIL